MGISPVLTHCRLAMRLFWQKRTQRTFANRQDWQWMIPFCRYFHQASRGRTAWEIKQGGLVSNYLLNCWFKTSTDGFAYTGGRSIAYHTWTVWFTHGELQNKKWTCARIVFFHMFDLVMNTTYTFLLNRRDQVTHICASRVNGSDNGVSPYHTKPLSVQLMLLVKL